MFLRPFYPVEEIGANAPGPEQLVNLLLQISGTPNVCHQILSRLNVRELLILLRGITKDELKDEFFNPNDLSEPFQTLWMEIVNMLNNYPCVKLVDKYSAVINESTTVNNSGMEGNMNGPGYTTDLQSTLESWGVPYTNGGSFGSDLGGRSGKEINWYELAIDSKEYDFLLEYLLDIIVNKIRFPLVEVRTKKFTKIYEVLDKHCTQLKITNDHLSVIKDSESLMSKLSVLTLTNYEYFEVAKKLKYKTLNVIGNEVDAFSVSTLNEKNVLLKTIYFRGRLKNNIPIGIRDGIDVFYDLTVFDNIDTAQVEQLGALDRFHNLYLNFTSETNMSLEWLKACKNLRYIYYSINYGDVPRVESLTDLGVLLNLEEVMLKYCDLRKKEIVKDTKRRSRNSTALPNLKYLTLINCQLNSRVLDCLFSDSLFDIFLVDNTIKFDSFVKLPRSLRNLTIINRDVNQCKDLIFLSYKVRSTNTIPCSRKCLLNLNGKLMTLRIPDSHDINLLKRADFYYGDESESLSIANMKLPFNSTLYFTVYPMFSKVDFSFLRRIVEHFHVARISIELYSFTNVFHDVCHIEGIDNVTIHRYGVFNLQENLRKILSKKHMEEKDKRFFLPYPCSRSEPSVGIFPKDYTVTDDGSSRSISPISEAKRKRRHDNNRGIDPRNDTSAIKLKGGLGRNSHLCEKCGKRFARSTALRRHLLVHKNHRPFKCDRCGNGFKRSDHLKAHQRVCTGNS
jgi:hypothetical protein